MTKEEIQYNKMITKPVKPLIITLGIPTVISMLITAIYNIADTFFVSKLGTSATGAVGVVFSLMAIIQAIGFTLGMGSGSYISAHLGEKKDDDAQKAGSIAFYHSLFIGLLVTILGLTFLSPLMKVLGATETVLPYAKSYATYILFGAPIMCGSFVLNNILRSQGKAALSMIGLTVGGILNIILDPIFIDVLNLGIKGAAIATLISQAVSFTLLLSCFIFKKSIITLSIKNFSFNYAILLEIVMIGFPSLCRQGLASISTVLLNRSAGMYGGDPALAAMSVASKVFMVMFAISLGIGQGFQPVCGYNYAAKKYKRVKEAMIFTLICGIIVMTTLSIFSYIFAYKLADIFSDEKDVKDIAKNALRYQALVNPLISVGVLCNMTFQSVRKKVLATTLSCARQGIFFIPLILLLPRFFKLNGVLLSQPFSDILTCLFAIPFFIIFVKKLDKMDKSHQSIEENLIK